ncbi:MAG: cell division protein FtsQ/DivIB [Luteibaculum sp.]
MLKKLRLIVSWGLMPLILVTLLAFNYQKQSELNCNALHVEVDAANNVFFVTKRDVETKILSRNPSLVGTPLKDVSLSDLENLLLEIPHVKHAKVYATIEGEIHVKVTQRKPIARFVFSDGGGMYLDKEGKILPLSKNYAARVLTVSGRLSKTWLKLKNESDGQLLHQIFVLASFIQQNEFLKAQLQQLYVNENQELEFIPRVGNHIIEFGDWSSYEKKFENLEIFYREGLAYKGWNRYEKISLKYRDQVVCTKK